MGGRDPLHVLMFVCRRLAVTFRLCDHQHNHFKAPCLGAWCEYAKKGGMPVATWADMQARPCSSAGVLKGRTTQFAILSMLLLLVMNSPRRSAQPELVMVWMTCTGLAQYCQGIDRGVQWAGASRGMGRRYVILGSSPTHFSWRKAQMPRVIGSTFGQPSTSLS